MRRYCIEYIIVILIFLTIVPNINALALYASQFNMLYNCDNPLVLTETTTLYLDEDIIVDGCMPFAVDISQFGVNDQLIFTSSVAGKLVLKTDTICDLSSFLPQGQAMLCTGNMEFIIEQGCVLRFDNNNFLIVDENVQFRFKESAA